MVSKFYVKFWRGEKIFFAKSIDGKFYRILSREKTDE